ncbi:hypothetical protein CRE_14127 [Caenorhabditis remanei]|uniref:Uncharacterized protein n=1 Tax=Caenorhabditis remanei TaxID=31234 RepID=E3MRE2_CAERE|nr:hypothetical protein CRE_14127 [Caenorhabditis remanei]
MSKSTIFTHFLILNSFCAVLSTNYHFTFHVKLRCRISRGKFGFRAQFFDKDVMWWNGDDPITEEYIDISPPGDITFKSEGMLTGDEWMSEYFAVKMVLYHNCNSMGKEVRVDMDIFPLAFISYNLEDNKYYDYKFTANITELSGDTWQHASLLQN